MITAGAWGTALSVVLLDNGYQPVLWDINAEAVRAINEENRCLKLPGVAIPEGLTATTDWREALSGASLVASAAPSTAIASISQDIARFIPADALFVSATKGLDPQTLRRPSQVWLDANPTLSERLAALSGPNFAAEIANRLPAATSVASASPVAADLVQCSGCHHFTGHRGDHPPGRGSGCLSPYLRRAFRRGRPGAHLNRAPVTKSSSRHRRGEGRAHPVVPRPDRLYGGGAHYREKRHDPRGTPGYLHADI